MKLCGYKRCGRSMSEAHKIRKWTSYHEEKGYVKAYNQTQNKNFE